MNMAAGDASKRRIRLGLQLQPEHATSHRPDYDLTELRDWIAWRDNQSS
jgi:hypothetical protein